MSDASLVSLNQEEPDVPQMPRHVAIIMDGNGRWAKERDLPRVEGHRQGVEAVRTITRVAGEYNLEYLTLYSFSSENWSRPETEISELFGLLRLFIRRNLAELHQNNVRIHIIGDEERVPSDISRSLLEAVELTRRNTGLNLVIAFNYGARGEIAQAAREIAAAVARGEIAIEDIDPATVTSHLQTSEIPDPDLIIRTSGEKRLSNFLLWQAAYAEFVFTDCKWPDFGEEAFLDAISEFYGRDRRFGAVTSATSGR